MPSSGGLVPLIIMYDEEGNKVEDSIIDTADTAVQIGTTTFNTECSEGYSLMIGGALGDITITQEAIAIKEVPAKEVTTMMSATFDNKGYVKNKECTYDGAVTPCSTIKILEELEAKLGEEIQKGENVVTVTEETVKTFNTVTCFNNDVVVECNDSEKMPYYNEQINKEEK